MLSEEIKLSRPFTGVLNDLRIQLEKQKDYDGMINLGLGNPGTPVDKTLQNILIAGIQENNGMSPYGSGVGKPETFKALADFLKNIRKTPYDFDSNYSQIAITGGITETIQKYLTVKSNQKSESGSKDNLKVLVPVPAYAFYFTAIKETPATEAIKINTRDTEWVLNA